MLWGALRLLLLRTSHSACLCWRQASYRWRECLWEHVRLYPSVQMFLRWFQVHFLKRSEAQSHRSSRLEHLLLLKRVRRQVKRLSLCLWNWDRRQPFSCFALERNEPLMEESIHTRRSDTLFLLDQRLYYQTSHSIVKILKVDRPARSWSLYSHRPIRILPRTKLEWVESLHTHLTPEEYYRLLCPFKLSLVLGKPIVISYSGLVRPCIAGLTSALPRPENFEMSYNCCKDTQHL